MQPPLTRVFLSSTIYDLKDVRNTVQKALRDQGYAVLASEDGSIPIDSSKHSYAICLKAAKNCECLIAIIDSRFGGVMPGSMVSITQAEVEAALDQGRQVLIFVRQAVWDAKEVYKAYKSKGHPFVPTKLVDDERVFDLINAISKRARANWIFQFNLPDDLIAKILFQLESIEASKDAELLGHIVVEEDMFSDPPKRCEVRGFPESKGPAIRLAVRNFCGGLSLDSHVVWFEPLVGKRQFLFSWKEIEAGMVDPSSF